MVIPLIVIDTNVCLDLFIFNDPQCQYLKTLLHTQKVKAIARNECREEWIRVLNYPNLKLNDLDQKQALATFDHLIEVVDIPKKDYRVLPCCKDPDDQKFLELAYDANALCIITKDKALLKLASKTKQLHLFQIIKPIESVIKSFF